ncbi:MAG: single-stranded DNA-binding protein [Phycisphaerae bacterium]
MANYNKIILLGNLTRDPQLSYLPSQTAVVEFGMAVNHRWRSQDGQQRETTCFIDCRCFGRQAEVINQYMSKGRPMLVEGRLDYDTWEGKDGTRRSKHRVFVERFQFVGGGGSGGGAPQGGGGGGAQYQRRPSGPAPQQEDGGYDQGGGQQYNDEPAPPDYGGEEDIPF